MGKNIIQEIVDRRLKDIASRGYNFGFEIPCQRTRPVHEFLAEKGAILEIKRASPSKGDIAPDLNAAEQALVYAKAGAAAISCLTEENYFKGNLADLIAVSQQLDLYEKETGKKAPALLRKDFLLEAEEVEVAYYCGADAVLLIARMLTEEKILEMAQKCAQLGISALVEVRAEEDLLKLKAIVENVPQAKIVCGVNSRDLKDFTIDLLKPLSMLEKIKNICGKEAKVIFESGIRTVEAAEFVSSLGFGGMLLGEAAARKPQMAADLVKAFVNSKENANSLFWKKVITILEKTSKPAVKICGLSINADYCKAFESGASFTGFVFCNASPRNIPNRETYIKTINFNEKLIVPLKVAVITDPESPEGKTALSLCREGIIDALQLHGINCIEKFFALKENQNLPHYCAVNLEKEGDIELLDRLFLKGEPRVLIDASSSTAIGGTGKRISSEIVNLAKKKFPLWLAGGINAENVSEIVKDFSPELIDLSSGLELFPGKKNHKKIEELFVNLNK